MMLKRSARSTVESMKESLTKASQTSSLLLGDLKDCHSNANPIEDIVVRGILQQAVELDRRLHELAEAVRSRKGEKSL